VISVPDVAIKIQLSDSDGARAVWVHRSRLGNVSTWFDRMATHSNVIELDHVRVGTLQACKLELLYKFHVRILLIACHNT
jgi:hypothetical protein